jgi:uncharacterized protein
MKQTGESAMNFAVISFFSIFLLIYSLLHVYVGLRGWQMVGDSSSFPRLEIYCLIIILLAATFPLARFGAVFLPRGLADFLSLAGSYWLGMLYYLFLILLLVDLVRFINRHTGILPTSLMLAPPMLSLLIVLVAGSLVLYGAWNARHPVIRHYEVTIPKSAQATEVLHAVMVSDIHLGKIIDSARLRELTHTIQLLDPDIVFFAGDIIDENVDLFAEENMADILSALQPRLGSYAILGNHEYIGRSPETVIQYLQQAGIIVLRDRWAETVNGIYIIGRDDLSRQRYGGLDRLDLEAVMTGIDHSRPMILLDHQPFHLEVAEQAGVDLQLSGHTHLGQLFPNNFITKAMYEIDWGYLQKGSLQVIVSCGFGTWGPPLRVGNKPEIVDITIHFDPSK